MNCFKADHKYVAYDRKWDLFSVLLYCEKCGHLKRETPDGGPTSDYYIMRDKRIRDELGQMNRLFREMKQTKDLKEVQRVLNGILERNL